MAGRPGAIIKYDKDIMQERLLRGNSGAGEMISVAVIVVRRVGGKKVPELMRGLGKGVKSFKDGMSDIEKESNDEGKDK